MDPSLSELIHNCRKSTGFPIKEAKYIALFGGRFNFTLTANNFGEFINGYCELAKEDERLDEGDGIAPKKLCIAELVDGRTTLPVIGDFHLKFHVEEGEEDRSYYGEDFPLRVIKCYQKAMSDLLNLTPGLSEYICCVLEGHSYRKGDMIHMHTMFQFPFCQLDIQYMKKVFKPYVEKLLRQNRLIEAFDTQPVGDWKDIIMETKDFYPMYRSTSQDGVPHLALTHIYGMIEDHHIEDSYCSDYKLTDVFKPGNHSFIYNGKVAVDSIPLEPEEDEDEDEFKKFWLPLFLSIHFWTGQTIPKEVASQKQGGERPSVYDIDDADSENPIRMAHSLIPLLNNERAEKDYSWLDVGRCLYNITKGSEEGLNMWISFSSRISAQGRDKNMCTYKYRELAGSNLSVKTLAWYARQDNEAGYNEWHISWCQKPLNEALNALHTDVAKAIYRFFWLEYVFSAETQCWYQYRGHHFYRVGREPICLRKEILDKFIGVYERMRAEVATQILSTQDDMTKKNLESKIKDINMLISKLKNENYRTTILKSAKDSFHVEEFEKLCDKNIYLTALHNCVLEVVDTKVRPRAGKPEDYVLKFSPIDYPFDYSWDAFWVKEVMHWFKQITVGDNDLRHYFLKRLSSFLRGLNPEKLFDVWTNEGNGGKSMLAKTIQYIFGSYFIDFPVSLLTGGGKNSSGPSPEIAQAMNARGAILSEPDDRDAMKGGMIKRITGGDRIFTRALHDNGGSMELTFKTIMICNRIPDIANVDKAIINRFVIMPFLGVWNDTAPEKEEDQFRMRNFKIDPFFEAKIPELARGLLWIIVQYYTHYATEGLKFPSIVQEYIKKHWEDNDFYLQFIAEKVTYAYKDGDKKEIDTEISLSASDIYQEFSRWFKIYYPGMQVPSLAQMKADLTMSGRLGPQGKRGQWIGVKLKVLVPELPGGGINI